MRLIDADELIKGLDNLCDATCPYPKAQRSVMCGACPLALSFDVVENAPTVDAVEVVRCKDCASWGNRVRSCDVGTSFNRKIDGNYLGDCIQFGIMTLPNFYCAWGEREDGASDN